MLTPVQRDWVRVAETVKRRRVELGLSQRVAARLADDISPTTWGQLEKRHQPVSALTAGSICKALRWTSDSIDRLLAGGEPVENGDVTEAPTLEKLAATVDRLTTIVEDLTSRVDELGSPRR